MIKNKTTKKAIKNRYSKIYNVGYCNIQSLLRHCEPFAYSSGAYGWSCDYYDMGGGVIICTGYSCIGEKIDRDILIEWENKAKNICLQNLPQEEGREALDDLVYKFLDCIE